MGNETEQTELRKECPGCYGNGWIIVDDFPDPSTEVCRRDRRFVMWIDYKVPDLGCDISLIREATPQIHLPRECRPQVRPPPLPSGRSER